MLCSSLSGCKIIFLLFFFLRKHLWQIYRGGWRGVIHCVVWHLGTGEFYIIYAMFAPFILRCENMGLSCMMLNLVSVSFLKDNSQWLKEQCMRMGDAYIIVYSVTDKSSFEKASELRIQLRRARQSENIPIILVGNKSDLVRSREVSADGKSVWFTKFWT